MTPKRALIIDLDNTVWDWAEVWFAYYSTMYAGIRPHVRVSDDELEKQIRVIHQKHGTSEYSFLLDELPALLDVFGTPEKMRKALKDEIHAFRRARKRALKIYPGMGDFLHNLRPQAVKIAAYTESLEFYTNRRLQQLSLDGVFDRVYFPADHPVPGDLERYHSDGDNTPKLTVTGHTPKGRLKPDADILLKIVNDLGMEPENCVYVGDSLMKDIPMAREAGVLDAYALYGEAQKRPEYEVLRRVSHWTDEDVEREKQILARPKIDPTITLNDSIAELLNFVRFENDG